MQVRLGSNQVTHIKLMAHNKQVASFIQEKINYLTKHNQLLPAVEADD